MDLADQSLKPLEPGAKISPSPFVVFVYGVLSQRCKVMEIDTACLVACLVSSFIPRLTLDRTHGLQDKRILKGRDLSCSGHRTGLRLRWEGATQEIIDSFICRASWRPAALFDFQLFWPGCHLDGDRVGACHLSSPLLLFPQTHLSLYGLAGV